MANTATETVSESMDRERDERSLHTAMRRFTKKWNPDHKDDAMDFQADLLLLVQAIHRDASRETHALLMNALAVMPPQTIFVDKPKP